jgi:hypothetical protein
MTAEVVPHQSLVSPVVGKVNLSTALYAFESLD